MPTDVHHVMIFVSNIKRSLYLFQDILGFTLQWHENLGGRDISSLVGIDDIEVEVAFLQSHPGGVAVELLRLISPRLEEKPARFGAVNSSGLTLVVENLDELHRRLTKEGWPPLTLPMNILTPGGEAARIFFFRTEDGLTVELIEMVTPPKEKA